MKQTILPSEMQRIEQHFMQQTGFPGLLLMEHAALAAHRVLLEMLPGPGQALFLCGSGNNGGDGLAMARLWAQAGGQARVWLAAPVESLPPDARSNAQALSAWGVEIKIVQNAPPTLPQGTGAVVDALLGTGLTRSVEGVYADLVELVNAAGLPVLAIDIPSGVDGATGRVLGVAVRATRTVTFHRPKPGHYLFPGRSLTGELIIADIGLPHSFDDADGYTVLERIDLPGRMPRRTLDAHKGNGGHLLIVAGSLGMAGAAALCAMAAVSAGAGLVTVACPAGILPILQTLVPGAMAVPLPEENGMLCAGAAGKLAALLERKSALALGPGLGRSPGVTEAIRPLLESSLPKVIDADALYALGQSPVVIPQAIYTPHPGEMARLTGASSVEIARATVETARAFVGESDLVLLLKGATTVIVNKNEISLNITGHPALAKGGSGDVLTGILGALLAQGLPRYETARLGALIHGLAGQEAAKEAGSLGLRPEALAKCVAGVLGRAEQA